jgi:gas vesicle protein
VVAFVKEGARGEVKFGITEEEMNEEENERDDKTLDDRRNYSDSVPNTPTSADVDKSYLWCERLQDVAAVSWDISILGKYAVTDYIRTIEEVVCSSSNNSDFDVIKTSYEVSELVSEVMTDASKDISPLVNEMWNDIVVTLLTKQCTAPLAAVKGVAATYRMTNRPPPTQASPFVHTILRPLSEFEISISKRVPTQVGLQWKKHIVDTVSEEYSSAVSELMDTVQKTEEALKNRKVRRAVAGGMSDGEKVRLQLYLDQEAFSKFAEEVGVDPTFVLGIQSLISLTKEAENLIEKAQIP